MSDKNEIVLSKEKKKELVDEIKSFFIDERGEEIGDLQADLLCEFFLKKIGIAAYNQALADTRVWLSRRFEDLEADYYSLEKDDKISNS